MRIFSCVVFALSVLAIGPAAWAQGSTGTRLAKPSEHPVNIIRLQPPSEIAEIRRLVIAGETDRAVELAEWLLASDPAPDIQYFGLNALCTTYSSARQLEKAMEFCNNALKIRPNYWMALNSRGTIYYQMGQMANALADYEASLSALNSKSSEAAIVRHNIALTKARQGLDS